jgi:hypothetical protein
MSDFDILEEIAHVETIAIGIHIPELPHLEKQYGGGRWLKMRDAQSCTQPNANTVDYVHKKNGKVVWIGR